MPLLNVKLIEGVFTPSQKQEMVRKLTDAMVSIEGENMRPATIVIVEEVKRRLGLWRQANHDRRCESAGSRQVQGLTRPQEGICGR